MIVVLRCYEVVSRLKVNVYKSSLIRVVVDPLITHLLADVMGCRVGSIPDNLSWVAFVLGQGAKIKVEPFGGE